MKKKLKKELRDQPLHFLWAGATFVLPFVAWGPAGLSSWWRISLVAVAALSLGVLCAREIWQKRDKPGGIFRNWPWLDSAFYALGAVVGVVVGIFAL